MPEILNKATRRRHKKLSSKRAYLRKKLWIYATVMKDDMDNYVQKEIQRGKRCLSTRAHVELQGENIYGDEYYKKYSSCYDYMHPWAMTAYVEDSLFLYRGMEDLIQSSDPYVCDICVQKREYNMLIDNAFVEAKKDLKWVNDQERTCAQDRASKTFNELRIRYPDKYTFERQSILSKKIINLFEEIKYCEKIQADLINNAVQAKINKYLTDRAPLEVGPSYEQ